MTNHARILELGLDAAGLQTWVESFACRPLFVTISGAHLYGFPSPDSDVDLRGCHQQTLPQVLRLDPPTETLENESILNGVEVEWVTHEVRKYLELLTKNNGYIQEQIFSPLILLGHDFLAQLRPLAQRCLTKHHYHHYRGFLGSQIKLWQQEQPRRVKPLLYCYRVALTGIHLLRTGEVEASLLVLNDSFRLPYIADLIASKTQEQATPAEVDVPFHEAELLRLQGVLEQTFHDSTLPEKPEREDVNQFLVQLRMSDI